MSAPDERWVAYVRGADRTGTLTALTSVFSSRGVSFESFATSDAREGTGLMTLVFTASPRLANVLRRTLERLAAVSSVTVIPASAARAVAVISTHAPGEPGQPANVEVVHGTLAEAEAAAKAAHETRPSASAAVVVLP